MLGTKREDMPNILDARLFRICVEVYNGRIDFSSLASLVSKLSSIAGQVSVHTIDQSGPRHVHNIRLDI